MNTLSHDRSTLSLRISPRRVALCLALAIATLASISIASDLIRFRNGHRATMTWWMAMFNLDREQNVSTYYQGLTIFVCALLVALIALHKWRERDSFRFHWSALGAIFLVLSLDEMCALHNQLEYMMARGGHEHHGVWHYSWVIPGLAFVGVVGMSYLWFLWRLPRRFGIAFAIAGLIYVGGAVGMEMVGGAVAERIGIGAGDVIGQNLPCAMLANVEETMEMLGIAIFMVSLLWYKNEFVPSVTICIGHGARETRGTSTAASVPAFKQAYKLGSLRVAPGLRPSGARTGKFTPAATG